MLFRGVKLVVKKFRDLPAEGQKILLEEARHARSTDSDILEKSGYNKALLQEQLRRDAACPPLLPQERQKRPYSHSTLGKKKLVRGIEKESVKT